MTSHPCSIYNRSYRSYLHELNCLLDESYLTKIHDIMSTQSTDSHTLMVTPEGSTRPASTYLLLSRSIGLTYTP